MELTNNTIASQYFHGKERFNCCQAVLKAFSHMTDMSDSYIQENFRKYGGGRAPENICGAAYAAVVLLKDKPEELQAIIEQFSNKTGATACREIRKAGLLSCSDCVELIGKLLVETGNFKMDANTQESL